MSRLRIVAGELGGRFIEAPSDRRSRPTREEVREAWFNALGPELSGLRVADLFAGSGALGLEALSRGAARVDFVESDRRTAAVLARNVAELGVGDRAEVLRRDVADVLDASGRAADGDALRWDLALADPPYGSGWPARLAERMRRAPFAGLLCVEHRPDALEGDEGVVWRRAYGDTGLTFVRAPASGGGGGGDEDAGAAGTEGRDEGDESTREGAPER